MKAETKIVLTPRGVSVNSGTETILLTKKADLTDALRAKLFDFDIALIEGFLRKFVATSQAKTLEAEVSKFRDAVKHITGVFANLELDDLVRLKAKEVIAYGKLVEDTLKKSK